ncbi:MAG: sugar phosphate isomerase [Lentisphaeria bacterium]|nr:sugar phosphate isomerase [Lentisphaeria bacterium]
MTYLEKARDFVENEKPFHLGFLPTEQSNPLTRGMDKVFAGSPADGVRMLQRVDRNVLEMAKKVFASEAFADFVATGTRVISNGGRIIFSGCGATGRLSILLEAMWRSYAGAKYAAHVESIMTGGDYALIKSVESFEDFAVFGARQVADRNMGPADLLVAITEGGETSSVLGTVAEATRRGCRAFLLFNNPAEILKEHLARSREAITNPMVTVLDLSCGPMALAGSTRMQATTSEQLIASAALDAILRNLSGEPGTVDYAGCFESLLDQVESERNVGMLADYMQFECGIYKQGGRVTYFVDDYLLDIFTDTTERSPTFMLPGFKKITDNILPEPWAFARNPLYCTGDAMKRAFGNRLPRCLEWTVEDYTRMVGADSPVTANPPKVSLADMMQIPVGNEPLPSRYATGKDAAVLFSFSAPRADLSGAYNKEAAAFAHTYRLSVPFTPEATGMHVFEHLAVKLMFNTISTGTMVLFGRVAGNWMSYVAVSNKKLIDRAIRLISELGEVDYVTAAETLYRAMEDLDAMPPDKEKPSPVQYTLGLLKK